jgi:surface protein
MSNNGLTFRLPDEEVSDHRPTSYPQFFNNDVNDNDSDGDIHTVKTNTSLTLHSIEDPNGSFPESSFDIPITTHVIQEDDDDECVADDEREISFCSMGSSRIINDPDPYKIHNRSVRPKNKCVIQPLVEHKQNSSLHLSSDWQVTNLNPHPLPRIITPTTSISRTATTTSSQTSQSDQNISNRYLMNEDLAMEDVERPTAMTNTDVTHVPVMQDQRLSNTAEVDNNWIKTSWSYLQMMAKMASSPIKFNSNNNHIVDLDDTIVSSTNNTQTNTINDIVSVNGADDQLTYDSSIFRNNSQQDGTILYNLYSMKDDTSTLPSADSTNDYFNVNSTSLQQQQIRASTLSLFDPVKMSHAGTRSTLFVAFGSNDDDDSNKDIDYDNVKKTMLPKTMDRTQENSNGNHSRGSKMLSTEQQRRRRCICWIGSLLVVLVLTFMISEIVCVFSSCRYLGFIPHLSRRSSDESKSENSIPVSPKTTPIYPPSAVPVNKFTDVPTVSPSFHDSVTIKPITSATTAPSLMLIDPPTLTPILLSPMPIPSMKVTPKLVLNTTEELYIAVDQFLTMYDDTVITTSTLPPINEWDVSQIYNMSFVFSSSRNPNARLFNADLHLWNTSRVVYMRSMFYQAENFNGDITTWDTSHVIDMYQTFTSAYKFNQDISMWNVSNAQEMSNMVR